MADWVYDTFAGSGTLATHVGEIGADWAAALLTPIGANLMVPDDLLYNTINDGLSVGGDWAKFLSTGTSPEAEAFVEMTVILGGPPSQYGGFQFELALTDGSLGGSISDGKLWVRGRLQVGYFGVWATAYAIADQADVEIGEFDSATPLVGYPAWGQPVTIRAELSADEIRVYLGGSFVGACPREAVPAPYSALGARAVFYVGSAPLGTVITSVKAGGLSAPAAPPVVFFWQTLAGSSEIP